jgi:hypothetical protein
MATIGGGGKGRVIAPWWELPAAAELLWQPEGEEKEGGWSGKSLITMRWLPTGQIATLFVSVCLPLSVFTGTLVSHGKFVL